MPQLNLLATNSTKWTLHNPSSIVQVTNFAFNCLGFGLQLPHIEVKNLGLRQAIGQDCTMTFSGPKLTRLAKGYHRPLLFNLVPGICCYAILGTFSEARICNQGESSSERTHSSLVTEALGDYTNGPSQSRPWARSDTSQYETL
jgi:hypothetical protein